MRAFLEYESLDSKFDAQVTSPLDPMFAPSLSDAFEGRLPVAWLAEQPNAARALQHDFFPDVLDRAEFVRKVQDSIYDRELSVFMQHLPTPEEENKGVVRWVLAVGQDKWARLLSGPPPPDYSEKLQFIEWMEDKASKLGKLFFTFTIAEPMLLPKSLWAPMVVIIKAVYLAKLHHDIPIPVDLTLVPLMLRLEAAKSIPEMTSGPDQEAERAETSVSAESGNDSTLVPSSDDIQSHTLDASPESDHPQASTGKHVAQRTVPKTTSTRADSSMSSSSRTSIEPKALEDAATITSSSPTTIASNPVSSSRGTKRVRDHDCGDEPSKKRSTIRVDSATLSSLSQQCPPHSPPSVAPLQAQQACETNVVETAQATKPKRSSAPKSSQTERAPSASREKLKASAGKALPQESSIRSTPAPVEEGQPDAVAEFGLTPDQKNRRRSLSPWAKLHFDARRYPYPNHDFEEFYATPSKAKESHHTNPPWDNAWDDDERKKETGRCKHYPKTFTTKVPPSVPKIRELGAVLIKSVEGDGLDFQSPVFVAHGPSKKGQVPGIDEFCVGPFDGKCVFSRKKGRPRTFDNGVYSGNYVALLHICARFLDPHPPTHWTLYYPFDQGNCDRASTLLSSHSSSRFLYYGGLEYRPLSSMDDICDFYYSNLHVVSAVHQAWEDEARSLESFCCLPSFFEDSAHPAELSATRASSEAETQTRSQEPVDETTASVSPPQSPGNARTSTNSWPPKSVVPPHQLTIYDELELCPYCDEPLPKPISTVLANALDTARPQSWQTKRYSNPNGWTAPFEVYADSEALETGEPRWPTVLDFAAIPERLKRYKNILDGIWRHPESSVFYNTLLVYYDQMGYRVASAPTGQQQTCWLGQPG
ncbi:hypothetical protein CALCODRAFT_536684 [Calocera cornea HHB12733]|uniref:Uncharacterized protein n=1 Tax=Calocera cornea HHB12733 TaxID=1353952 RepID=A0A165HLS5_9BASI|nr:hypothetical protein CALCODRAFT_536684 [Calocera cornea HHB12733]